MTGSVFGSFWRDGIWDWIWLGYDGIDTTQRVSFVVQIYVSITS